MTTVILGASGQLGTALLAHHPDAVGVTRPDLNLATADRSDLLSRLQSYRPRAVINAAAYTAVDRAESEADLAHQVNAVAVGDLAEMCAQLAIPFVTYSTDYVFDGTSTSPYVESSPRRPLSVYGRTKAEGEDLALANAEALIIRTSWVISGTHRNFVTTMLGKAEAGDLRVVDDQIGRPTYVGDLAQATIAALQADLSGVVHLTNRGAPTSWYGLAREILGHAGFDPALVQPCSTAEYPTAAVRPSYSVMESEIPEVEGFALRPWEEMLPGLIAAIGSV